MFRIKSTFQLNSFIRYFCNYRKRNTMRIERDGTSNTIIYHPDDGKHSATVILSHGLGDSGDGLSDLADHWIRYLPHVKFILPTAPVRPVTLNGGMPMTAWYDIVGLTDRESESCEGINDSVHTIKTLLDAEYKLGMPYERIVLAGFSQGGALSLFTGLQLPVEHKLAGLLVLSGYLPGRSQFKLSEGLESLPVLHCHGAVDPVVIPKWAEMTKDGLMQLGMKNYDLRMYDDVPHSLNFQIRQDAQDFLAVRLPHDEAFIIKPKPPSEMSVKELKLSIRQYGLGSQAIGFTEKYEFVKLLEDYHNSK